MARRITQKDGAAAVAKLGQDGTTRTDDVPVPHLFRPTTGAKNQPCAECFAIATDPTFAERHAVAPTKRQSLQSEKVATPKATAPKAARPRRQSVCALCSSRARRSMRSPERLTT